MSPQRPLGFVAVYSRLNECQKKATVLIRSVSPGLIRGHGHVSLGLEIVEACAGIPLLQGRSS